MKLRLIAFTVIALLPVLARAQQQDEWLCKGKPVPAGYRIVGEIVAPDCGGNAWVIRKKGAPPPPIAASERPSSELGVGVPDAERKTVRRLQAGGKDVVNIPVQVNGTLQLSAYYGGAYASAETTHAAFELSDGTGTTFVYALKDETGELRKKIAAGKGKLKGSFTIVVPAERQAGEELFADLIGYKLAPPPAAATTSDAPARGETAAPSSPQQRSNRTKTRPTRVVPSNERKRNDGGETILFAQRNFIARVVTSD